MAVKLIKDEPVSKLITTLEVTDDFLAYPVDRFFIDIEVSETGDKKIWLYGDNAWAKMDITDDFADEDLSNLVKLNELVQNNLTEYCHIFEYKC